MPDNQVEIVFKTTAELQGAIAAQNELEKTRGKLLALGKDTVEVDAQLARANELISKGVPGEEPGRPFEQATLKGGELRKIIREISHESPALGLALRAAINPVVAAITAAIFVAQKLHETFARINAQLDPGKWESTAKAQQAQVEAFRAMTVEAAAFAREATAAETATKKTTDALSEQIGILQRRARLIDEEQDAHKALEKEKVDAAEKSGAIETTEATRQRMMIDLKYEAAAVARKDAEQRAELATKQSALDKLQSDQSGKGAAIRTAEEAFQAPGVVAPAVVNAQLTRTEANAVQAEETLKKTRARMAELEQSSTLGPVRLRELETLKTAEPAQAEAASAARKLFEAQQKKAAEQLIQWDDLTAVLKDARSDYLAGSRAIRTLSVQTADFAASLAEETAARRRILGLHAQTEQVKVAGELTPGFAKNVAASTSPYSGTRDEGGGQPSDAQRAAFAQMGISMSDALVPLILQATKDAVEAAKRRTEQLLSVGKATQN